MVTLKEIASECNVSAATVSNVLNGKNKVSEKTRQKVLEVVRKRGYQPNYIAQGLRTQKTKTVGIIAEDIAQFTTPEIVEGIMSHCEERGYRTIVKNLRLYARWNDTWYGNEQAYHSILDPTLQEVVSLMVDGIIYIAGHARIISCFPPDFALPAVMSHAYAQNPRVPSVLVDDVSSAYEIVKYLISQGHRKIGVIGGRADNIHTQRRLEGYQRALYEANILFDPKLIQYASWDMDSAYKVAGKVLQPGVTAVFCMTDRMAGGVYRFLDEQGMRVGEHVSVAGFDNQDIAEYFVPGLTTTAMPLMEMGTVSARLLIEQIEGTETEGERQHKEILIPCSFIQRESVRVI